MSTRSCVGILESEMPIKFKGIYVHYNGWPDFTGRLMYETLNAIAPKERLVFMQNRLKTCKQGLRTWSEPYLPEDGRMQRLTEKSASEFGVEYAFMLKDDCFFVLCNYHKNGHKAIGAFGTGDSEAIWKIIYKVSFQDALVDFKQIDWEVLIKEGAKQI